MRALLDTHALLWWLRDDQRLSSKARQILSDPDSELFFSAASAWEIVIKVGTGALVLGEPPETYIPRQLTVNRIMALPIDMSHVLAVSHLPQHHRDPFDRILVAQSQIESLPIVTIDPEIAKYPITVIW